MTNCLCVQADLGQHFSLYAYFLHPAFGIHYHYNLQVFSIWTSFNSLPSSKILDLPKFKAFAGNKIILIQKLKFVLRRVENIVGKGENAGYQHFHLFPECFQKLFFSRGVKSRDCVVKG